MNRIIFLILRAIRNAINSIISQEEDRYEIEKMIDIQLEIIKGKRD